MIKRIIATALGLLSVIAYGADSTPLKCQLNDTTDQFWFYKEQLVYSSNQFVVFQNFKGRVVTQVDLKTNELIRSTYLGDSYEPKYQILLGYCDNATHTLNMWSIDEVPLDSQ